MYYLAFRVFGPLHAPRSQRFCITSHVVYVASSCFSIVKGAVLTHLWLFARPRKSVVEGRQCTPSETRYSSRALKHCLGAQKTGCSSLPSFVWSRHVPAVCATPSSRPARRHDAGGHAFEHGPVSVVVSRKRRAGRAITAFGFVSCQRGSVRNDSAAYSQDIGSGHLTEMEANQITKTKRIKKSLAILA